MRWLIAVLLGGLSALAGLPDSKACSPPAPGLRNTMPADGGTYPANGIVLFFGDGIALDATVTVDGAPASLVQATEFPVGFVGGMGARVQPEPAAGQEVIITGDFCSDEVDPSFGCEVQTVRFVTTDAERPATCAIERELRGLRSSDFRSGGGDCQSDSDLAWFVHVDSAAPEAGGTPVAHMVEGIARAPESSFMKLVSWRVHRPT